MSGFQLNVEDFRTHYNNLCAQWHDLDAQVKTLEGLADQASDTSQGESAGVFVKVVAAKQSAKNDAQKQLAVTRLQQARLSTFLDAARQAFVDYGTSQEESALRLLRAAAVDSDPFVTAGEGMAAVGGGVGMVGVGVEEAAMVNDLGGDAASGQTAGDASSSSSASGSAGQTGASSSGGSHDTTQYGFA